MSALSSVTTFGAVSRMPPALAALAREGRLLVFFPEGTFTRSAGLSGFYLGAFKVAAEAGLPVLPGIIEGRGRCCAATNGFRAGRRSACTSPQRSGRPDRLQSMLKCRDSCAKRFWRHCGEPDLGELVRAATEPAAA